MEDDDRRRTQGGRFDEATDWRGFVREVASGGYPAGLDTGNRHDAFSLFDLLGQLSEAMDGTPMAARLADAALDLLEDGLRTRDDLAIQVAHALPYRRATGAFDRLLAIWETRRHRLSVENRDWLLGDLLELQPEDPRTQQLAIEAMQQADAPDWVFEHAARHMPEWLADNLPRLRPVGHVPRALWILLAPADSRHLLLSAIARLGDSHVAALVAEILDPLFPEEPRRQLVAELERNAAFAGRMK